MELEGVSKPLITNQINTYASYRVVPEDSYPLCTYMHQGHQCSFFYFRLSFISLRNLSMHTVFNKRSYRKHAYKLFLHQL